MSASLWSRSVSAVSGRLFGGTCYLCRGESRATLCPDCHADLPFLPRPRCPQCASPSFGASVCGRCLAESPAYDATVAVFAYAFPADVLVQGLKFRGDLSLAALLAGELADELGRGAAEPVDFIVPVPLHDARVRDRGYNQAMEIARGLASRGGAAVMPDLCVRVRETAAQLELPLKERRANVRGAFSCRRSIEGRRVAVVDDVMTSGATLHEVASTLKKFGAARVVNWVVARTPAD